MPTEQQIAPSLNTNETKAVQEIMGALLLYARGPDPTMLVALKELNTQQSKATQDTKV